MTFYDSTCILIHVPAVSIEGGTCSVAFRHTILDHSTDSKADDIIFDYHSGRRHFIGGMIHLEFIILPGRYFDTWKGDVSFNHRSVDSGDHNSCIFSGRFTVAGGVRGAQTNIYRISGVLQKFWKFYISTWRLCLFYEKAISIPFRSGACSFQSIHSTHQVISVSSDHSTFLVNSWGDVFVDSRRLRRALFTMHSTVCIRPGKSSFLMKHRRFTAGGERVLLIFMFGICSFLVS